jgi:hypothetical protein
MCRTTRVELEDSYNKLLLEAKDPELTSRTHKALMEAKKAAQRSTCKLRKIQRRLHFLHSGLGASSTMEHPM